MNSLEKKTRAAYTGTKWLTDDLKSIRRNSHITGYRGSQLDMKSMIMGACRPDYAVSPDLVNNSADIKMRIELFAKQYGLNADLNQDNGFSFAYQLTLFFPTHFQK